MYRTEGYLKIADQKSCVLYEASSGKIVSIYHSVAYEGAEPIAGNEELQSTAMKASKQLLRAASEPPFDEKNIKALFTTPDVFDKPGLKKVDLKQMAVVAAD